MSLNNIIIIIFIITSIFFSCSKDLNSLQGNECELIISVDKNEYSISQDSIFSHTYFNDSNRLICVTGYSFEENVENNWGNEVGWVHMDGDFGFKPGDTRHDSDIFPKERFNSVPGIYRLKIYFIYGDEIDGSFIKTRFCVSDEFKIKE